MKLKLVEIYNARISLDKLFSEERLTQKMKYRLGFLIKELKDITEQQQELMIKHGAVAKNGGYVLEENTGDYGKEFFEFLNEEIEVRYTAISLEELENLKDENDEMIVKLNAYDYQTLIDTFIDPGDKLD